MHCLFTLDQLFSLNKLIYIRFELANSFLVGSSWHNYFFFLFQDEEKKGKSRKAESLFSFKMCVERQTRKLTKILARTMEYVKQQITYNREIQADNFVFDLVKNSVTQFPFHLIYKHMANADILLKTLSTVGQTKEERIAGANQRHMKLNSLFKFK